MKRSWNAVANEPRYLPPDKARQCHPFDRQVPNSLRLRRAYSASLDTSACAFQINRHCSRISAVSRFINHRLSIEHTKIISLSHCPVLEVPLVSLTSLPGSGGCRKFTAFVGTCTSTMHCLIGSPNQPASRHILFFRLISIHSVLRAVFLS